MSIIVFMITTAVITYKSTILHKLLCMIHVGPSTAIILVTLLVLRFLLLGSKTCGRLVQLLAILYVPPVISSCYFYYNITPEKQYL